MSMYKRIMLLISCMVAVTLAVICMGMIYYTNLQAKSELEQKVKLMAGNLAVSTATFVWEMDPSPIEEIIDRFVEDKDISYINILDGKGKQLTKKRDYVNDSKIKVYERKIFHDKNVIGKVSLGYNEKRIEKNGNTTIVWISIAIVCAFLLVVLSIHIILRSMILPLTRVSEKLAKTVIGLKSSAEELSSSGTVLSSSVSAQASSLQQSSASLEELTGMVNNNLSNAKESSEYAETVTTSSQRGNEAMNELVKSMQGITESNENIQKLSSILSEIATKTQVIDEIVFQTKLLSFNASVEAERAGEHGRGFAVVAQEVGNLAQMSGKAASEISSIIKESIASAQTITEENKERVDEGSKFVTETGIILQDIYEKSKVVSDFAKKILGASNEQATGIEEINRAVSELDSTTQKNSQIADNTKDSSVHIKTEAEGLAMIVDELNSVVLGKRLHPETTINITSSGIEDEEIVAPVIRAQESKVIKVKQEINNDSWDTI